MHVITPKGRGMIILPLVPFHVLREKESMDFRIHLSAVECFHGKVFRDSMFLLYQANEADLHNGIDPNRGLAFVVHN